MTSKRTTPDFIELSRNVHGDFYDYSNVVYVNNREKVKIICPEHGAFLITPANHLRKRGCSKCANKKKCKELKSFTEEASKTHGKKYDYSLSKYKNGSTKTKILCHNHGMFLQTPHSHLSGHGCSKCRDEIVKNTHTQTIDDFILRATQTHGKRYDYSQVVYNGCEEKVKIICKKHGEFLQAPNNHINSKQGCPKCCLSKGEEKVRLFLETNRLEYSYQKMFDGCRNPKTGCLLKFDFFVPRQNVLIEYDGEQHYQSTPRLQKYKFTQKDVDQIKYRDNIKSTFSSENGIKLIRISYLEKTQIDDILRKELL